MRVLILGGMALAILAAVVVAMWIRFLREEERMDESCKRDNEPWGV